MPNSLLCPNSDLKQPPLKDPLKTHTLVYHNLDSSPTNSNDLFVTPKSDFSEDPLPAKKNDVTFKNDVTSKVLSSAGSSLNTSPSSAVDYSLLNNTKCPVSRICLINDELAGPCLSPQAILLINNEELQSPCFSPLSSEEVVLSTLDYTSPEAMNDVIASKNDVIASKNNVIASGSSCSPKVQSNNQMMHRFVSFV